MSAAPGGAGSASARARAARAAVAAARAAEAPDQEAQEPRAPACERRTSAPAAAGAGEAAGGEAQAPAVTAADAADDPAREGPRPPGPGLVGPGADETGAGGPGADGAASAAGEAPQATRGGARAEGSGQGTSPAAPLAAAPADGDAPPEGTPVIQLAGLTVRAGGKTLLEGVDLVVRRGERVLLVGPSGAGKSVLLKLLTGLLEPDGAVEIEGTARVAGVDVLAPRAAQRRRLHDAVGLVFQDHALLDELTARDNLLFARDHAATLDAAAATDRALRFLEEHGIPPGARVRALSGGQRQRVAVARALARAPELVFYDEPTSALDPRSSRAVAALIREASAATTSVVVTHDYPPFEGTVGRVLLLDAERRALRELGWGELEAVMAEARGGAPPAAPPASGPLAALAGAVGAVLDAAAATPALALAGVLAPLALVPWRARPLWFLRWLAHYAHLAFLGSALPYNAIAGTIAGFVATYFTYKFLPRPELSEPLILDDVLPALGFALYRVVVPVLVTLLLAGRTGAALASDFGTRVYQHQTVAMRSLGAPVGAYLGTAALWANLAGVLVVALVAFGAAALTSLAVFTVIRPELTPFAWSTHFWRRLEPFAWGVAGQGWGWVATKLLASSAAVVAMAWLFGTSPKRSTADVSRGITRTVYWGTVLVLLVHFVCAFFEFERPPRF